MAKLTKKGVISRMQSNKPLQEILGIEPRLKDIIKDAELQKNTTGYHRIRKYDEFKDRINNLVGTFSENEQLRSSHSHEIVRSTIDDLLPPDAADKN